MKRKSIYIIILFLLPFFAKGQYIPQFSQLLKTLEFVNPGYNASKNTASATLLYRNQWTGFEGAPKSMAANVNVPINKWHTGFGLNTMVETMGLINQSFIDLTACTDVKISGNSYMAFGISGGVDIKRFDMERAIYESMNTNTYASDFFNSENLHIGTGINYFTNKLHLGASMHFTPLNNAYKQNEMYSFYLNGSYLFPLDENWVIKPAVLFKSWANYSAFDAGLYLLFKDLVWGGISYRLNDAIIFFADVKITDTIRLGYSFDYGVHHLNWFNNGSHELRIEFTMPRRKTQFERMAIH